MLPERFRSPRLPQYLIDSYKKIILEEQRRQLDDDEAEPEVRSVVETHLLLLEMQSQEDDRKKLHRTLTNGFKERKLRPVDERFFGNQ